MFANKSFGNNPQPLFGNNNNGISQQPTGGGLFANMATNNTSNIGFGGVTQNNNNLFGANNNQPQQSGLFGGLANNNASMPNNQSVGGGGLFGQSQQMGSLGGGGGGGLFGQSQPNNIGGGLFGANTNNNGIGVTNNNSFNNQNQGGLFANNVGGISNGNMLNNAQNFDQNNAMMGGIKTAVGGGLFGQNNNNNNTLGGGIFGQTPTNTANGGGLFGAPQNNFGQNTNAMGGGGLFGSLNNTPNNTGIGLGFGNTNNNPIGGILGGGNNNAPGFGNLGSALGNNNNTFGNNSGLFGNNNPSTNTAFNTGGSIFGNNTTTPATNTFGFNNNSNNIMNNNNPNKSLFGANTTAPNPMSNFSTFGANNQNQGFNNTNMKKFQPSKPRNETLTKQKNALVSCITTMDEYHTFSKQQLRVQFLMNGGQMPQQQNNLLGQPQNNSFGFNLGLGTQPVQQPSLFSSPNVGQVQNQNNNAIFGNSPQQMLNKSAVSLFNNTQPTGINPSTNATSPIFGGFQQNQPNTQAPTSIFGNTGGTQNNAGNSLFGNVSQTNAGQNGLFGSNNLNQTPSLFGQNNTTSPLFGNTANNPPANSLFGTTNYGQNFSNIPLNQGITQNSFLPDPNSFNRNIQTLLNQPIFQNSNSYQYPNLGDVINGFLRRQLQLNNIMYNRVNPTFDVTVNNTINQTNSYQTLKKTLIDPNNAPSQPKTERDSWTQFKQKALQKSRSDRLQDANGYKKRQTVGKKDKLEKISVIKQDQVIDNFFKKRQQKQIITNQIDTPDQYDFLKIKYVKKQEPKKIFDEPIVPDDLKIQPIQQHLEQIPNLTNSSSYNDLADIDQIPRCTKYQMNPSIAQLSRYTTTKLKSVHKLKIWNNFGSVQFLQPVNLIRANLDQLISIEQDSIEIINNKDEFKIQKGKTLLTYFNFGKYLQRMNKNDGNQRNIKHQKFIKKMNLWIKKYGMELVEFNQRNATLQVKV